MTGKRFEIYKYEMFENEWKLVAYCRGSETYFYTQKGYVVIPSHRDFIRDRLFFQEHENRPTLPEIYGESPFHPEDFRKI